MFCRLGGGYPEIGMATRPFDTSAASGAQRERPRRILVLANEAVGGERLVEEIARRAGAGAEARIVAPTLVRSPLDLAAGDLDDDRETARRKMQVSIEALRGKDVAASGEVGEADPILAIRDGLVRFPADEVIIVAHPSERATWLERDIVERARREVSVPITHIELEPDGAEGRIKDVREVSSVRAEAQADLAQAEFETDYLPPMSRRDRLALAVGPLGTLSLWLMAANCRGDLFHDYSADDPACIALLTIAILATIVTIIHVPMLLLLRSGNYKGGLADFMAKTVLYGIPAAVAAGIALTIASA